MREYLIVIGWNRVDMMSRSLLCKKSMLISSDSNKINLVMRCYSFKKMKVTS